MTTPPHDYNPTSNDLLESLIAKRKATSPPPAPLTPPSFVP
ncbi:MAG TPA: hypothetical protein VL986_09060 [Terracidiphilus sp.]|nr:hypothetical protein [Terracidiphilus sp.]